MIEVLEQQLAAYATRTQTSGAKSRFNAPSWRDDLAPREPGLLL
ncbi:MAG TPA: hypothetical protein VF844_11180 [Ktedonobacteraceae bacterium]